MKKLLSILLVLAIMLAAFAGCSAKDDNKAQIANPINECSEEELAEVTGVSLTAPEGAENAKYAYIDAEEKIAQVEFTLDGNSYCYRAKVTSEIIDMDPFSSDADAFDVDVDLTNPDEDPFSGKDGFEEAVGKVDEAADKVDKAIEVCEELSGYYEKWNINGAEKVAYCPAVLVAKEKGAAVITWFDEVPGILYSLSTNKYTSNTVLAEVANACFVPAQGEVG